MIQSYKTELCKFYLKNCCRKGPACTYAHSKSEIRENLDPFSELCPEWLQTGTCDRQDCPYSHSCSSSKMFTRLPSRSSLKSRMCRFADQGRCKWGQSCRFAHSIDELVHLSDGAGLTQDDIYPSTAASSSEAAVPSEQEDIVSLRKNANVSDISKEIDHSPLFQQECSTEESDFAGHNRGALQLPATGGPQESPNAGDDGSGSGSGSEWETDQSSSDGSGSTKAHTTATISTPRGGDSGNETTNTLKECKPTTMIVKHVPESLTQGALVSLFEDLSPSMRATFDFFYLPWNPHSGRNLGYAIINFFDAQGAATFKREWHTRDLTQGHGGEKGLQVLPAILQGRFANIKHFSAFSLALDANLRFRPLLRQNPREPLRAMYISPELIEEPAGGGF